MNPIAIIEKKREGGILTEKEIQWVIRQYSGGSLPDYQMSSLLMAIFIRGMEEEEILALTQAMLDSGERIDFGDLSPIPVDKHSTGGVGDKITLPLVPLVLCHGVPVPMLSGRSLGFSGGTLDKLESIPGMQVNLSLEVYKEKVRGFGGVVMGQTGELAPADKKIYALRDVTGTVPSIPLITASILSKKAAGGAKGLVLDVKSGSGAFMKSKDDAQALARMLVRIGTKLGLNISGYITDMSQPLGQFVGNALEVKESIDILKGEGPEDTTELTVLLAGEMLNLADITETVEEGKKKARESINNGNGVKKFKDLIENQGGNPDVVDNQDLLAKAPNIKDLSLAQGSGWVSEINAENIGVAAVQLGAGRIEVEDEVDHSVGMELLKKVGDPVEEGEPIVQIHYSDRSNLEEAEKIIQQAYKISPEEPKSEPFDLIRISMDDE